MLQLAHPLFCGDSGETAFPYDAVHSYIFSLVLFSMLVALPPSEVVTFRGLVVAASITGSLTSSLLIADFQVRHHVYLPPDRIIRPCFLPEWRMPVNWPSRHQTVSYIHE